MNLMGLDPSTNTGFAICGDDGQIHTTGRWSPKAKAPKEAPAEEKARVNAEVACEARRWIMGMIRTHDLHMIAFEELHSTITNSADGKPMNEPVSRNKQAAIQIGLRMGCAELSVPFQAFADSTWRKSFLGHARRIGRKALKEEAKAMCEAMAIQAKNEDAREAAGVLFHFQCVLRHPRHKQVSAGALFEGKEQAA